MEGSTAPGTPRGKVGNPLDPHYGGHSRAPPGEPTPGSPTGDPFITSEVLYQLSYVGAAGEF